MQSAPKHSQTLAGVWLNKFSILLHYTYYMQTKNSYQRQRILQQQPMEYKKMKEWTTRERQNNGTTESVALQGASASISQLVYI